LLYLAAGLEITTACEGVFTDATQMNPEKRPILPDLAFRGFSSRYQRPSLSEGFEDITEVAFKVGSSHA
jgi:hypothetical protein